MAKLQKTIALTIFTMALSTAGYVLYPRILGVEIWSSIALLIIAQSAGVVLESGLFQASARDFALHPAHKSQLSALWLPGYIGVAGVSALLVLALAWSLIGEINWLAMIFSFIAGLTVISGLLNALEIGCGQQHRAAMRAAIIATIRHAGGLLAASITGSMAAVVAMFLIAAIAEFSWAGLQLGKKILSNKILSWGKGWVWLRRRGTWMLAASAVGSLVAQGDRLLAGYTIDPNIAGMYLVVAQLCMGFMQLQYPIQRELYRYFHLPSRRTACLPFPPFAIMRVLTLCGAPLILAALVAPLILPLLLPAANDNSMLYTQWTWILLLSIFINAIASLYFYAANRFGQDVIVLYSNLAGGLIGLIFFIFTYQLFPYHASPMYWLGLALGMTITSIFLMRRSLFPS